jgi:RNA polymerase sigma-70 factor (ECF subfamily)
MVAAARGSAATEVDLGCIGLVPDRSTAPLAVAPEFAEFYAASFPQLLTQLHAFVGDRAEAQDLVQEAYTRAFARWAAVSRFEDPVGWVRRVAWNLAISRWRRARRLLHFRRDLAPGDVAGPDVLSLDLTRALAKLPPVYRQAVVLHYVADLPVRDIATFTGAAEGTVKARLHRARTMLNELLSLDDGRSGDD